jgi:hypothetical protein
MGLFGKEQQRQTIKIEIEEVLAVVRVAFGS